MATHPADVRDIKWHKIRFKLHNWALLEFHYLTWTSNAYELLAFNTLTINPMSETDHNPKPYP